MACLVGRAEAGASSDEGRNPAPRALSPAAIGGALHAALAATAAAAAARTQEPPVASLTKTPAPQDRAVAPPSALKVTSAKARGLADAARREALKISAYMLAAQAPRLSVLQGGAALYTGLPTAAPEDTLRGRTGGTRLPAPVQASKRGGWRCCCCC